MEKLKELYTVAEVAGILGVSEKSVRDFINAGELRGVKVGKWRIAQESIEAFMDARSNHYQDKARSEVLGFLDDSEPKGAGEERTLIIRDYYTPDAGNHGPLGSWLMQQLPPGRNVKWRFFHDQGLARARHIFTGNFQVITQLIQQLEQKLREED